MSRNDVKSTAAASGAGSRRDFLKKSAAAGAMAPIAGAGMLAAANNAAGATAADGTPIKIGAAIPLTGYAAGDGLEAQRGFELAVEDVNNLGGVLGRPLELVSEDTGEMGPDLTIQALQRLIDRHNVHAVFANYNTGTQTAEYDTIADSGILYVHANTDIIHHETVSGDPDRYFGVFMGDPAEYWYGEGLLKFLNDLQASGQYDPPNRKIVIITSSVSYSAVIANAIKTNAEEYGWEIALEEIVTVPLSEWGPTLAKIREINPAVIANTHYLAQDLAQFMVQFTPNPTDSLVYMQYGPSLPAFRNIAQESANGVIYSTVLGTLPDELGQPFNKRYRERFGADSSPKLGGAMYDFINQWAIAAALAGGSGGPGEEETNRRVADRLRALTYRGLGGTIRYMVPEQAATPYPNATPDPSLGMPHQFLQIQDYREDEVLIAPWPYQTAEFKLPPWIG
jgi:branched-chain amino acid transport system substrate-binding protein